MAQRIGQNYLGNMNNKKLNDPTKYSVVSFFCGCGGLDLGFLGGFEYRGKSFADTQYSILSAFDYDDDCVETYKKNIGTHAKKMDLSNYDVKQVPKADVLLGGFPCQDFASCGPRLGLKSDRGETVSITNYLYENS